MCIRDSDLPSRMKGVHAAVMTVGGWFDTEDLYGPLHLYQAIEKNNPGIQNTLVMGPWTHGGWLGSKGDQVGDAEFGRETSLDYQPVEFAFFKPVSYTHLDVYKRQIAR